MKLFLLSYPYRKMSFSVPAPPKGFRNTGKENSLWVKLSRARENLYGALETLSRMDFERLML